MFASSPTTRTVPLGTIKMHLHVLDCLVSFCDSVDFERMVYMEKI